MKTKIYLHGRLGRICGSFFELNIHHAREALYALSTQLPEFKKIIQSGEWAIFRKRQSLTIEQLELNCAGGELHIVPKPKGAKNSGFAQILIGAALITAGYFSVGTALAPIAGGLSAAGTGLVISGALTMLSPQPSYDNDYSTTDPNASTLFSGVDNVATPGAPVPLIYGEHLVGSSVVSSQYKTL
ncbi:tail assembly protein [Piscirickettsia salmonis]|uniref:tail assembly protein n=1 Tax=Piscirickettsia salmonis TaxID=1238 RepID=UPI00031636AD|nr:tail assembly protein [Piscirickettsia salmonis]APS59138.1 hypothetical protein AVI52_18090 [Piscirickettsia salmonis]ERL62190.1 hypothetical protein K661_01456 [Piscirickettsia salmonis LF-89 = ATCC VR-1361]PEQ17697.1 tail assembly protein [Piscirickettsia salmonis]QGN79297.1 Phage-related protein, tail component [Piscirickettsia salmonis]QGN82888.1 Phage-related protein, tail component [Piscirickettsia salmonis]